MMASSLRLDVATVSCSESGRLSCRSMDHWLLPSLYDPVISKLSAASRVPVAPLSRLRVVGRSRPNGRSQAESAAMTTAPINPARARYDAYNRKRNTDKALGCNGLSIPTVTQP